MTRADVEQALRDLQVTAYNGVIDARDVEEVMDIIDDFVVATIREINRGTD